MGNANKKININYNFKNKVVLITGASKGIGFEIAKNYLKYNANLVICSRSNKKCPG